VKIEDEIARCTECEACMEVCPTYHATRELLFSPMYRLKTAGQYLAEMTLSHAWLRASIIALNACNVRLFARKR